MNIIVNEELQAYIDPLTAEEHEALERSILAEGCRDALVLWGDVLVDGHNRHGICRKHGLPFQTVQHPRFQSMADVHLWMIDQHLGRRSVSDFQRGVLALRKREILAQRSAPANAPSVVSACQTASGAAETAPDTTHAEAPPPWDTAPIKSRADIAKAARLSHSQVGMIEKIQTRAVPELVAAVKSGTISINAAAAVSTLPAEAQKRPPHWPARTSSSRPPSGCEKSSAKPPNLAQQMTAVMWARPHRRPMRCRPCMPGSPRSLKKTSACASRWPTCKPGWAGEACAGAGQPLPG